MLTYLNPRRGLAILTFGVIAIALGMAFPLARTDSQLVAQQALPDEVLFTTNIIFDHSAPTQNPGSPPEIQPFYQDSDGIDLGRWIAKDLHHKGGGVDLKHDADSGEYVWKCPVASGGVLPQRSGSPSRNEPALYDVEKFASTVIHVRFQWPVVGSWEGIKEAEIWAEPIASALPPPPGMTAWPPLPKLVLSETKEDGTAHVKVEFEKKDHATAAGVSKGISLPGGYLKFKPEAGYTIPAAMWRFVDVKWQWKAKDIVYHGNGGGPAQMDFDVSGPHRIYMTRKAPRAPWVNEAVKKDNPSTKALDFLFDKCEVQGVSDFSTMGNNIATYLHRKDSGHGLEYDHVYGAAGYIRQRSGGFGLPPGAPSNAPLNRFGVAGSSTTGIVEFNIDAFIDKSGFGKRPSDERLGRRPGGGDWPERDSNHVGCYDCAASMTAFLALCGADVHYRHMQPFGYLKPLAFCATGTVCNNPYFNKPGVVPNALVGNNDLMSQRNPDGLQKRTAFGNHAFSSISAGGSETKLYDWNAGPALNLGVSGYISDTIDKSIPDEVEFSGSWPSPPPAIPGSVTNWNQPIAGTADHITSPGRFLIRINDIRKTHYDPGETPYD